MKKQLLERIETLETLITVYSDRDEVRTSDLQKELKVLNMQVLELMTSEVA